MTVPSTPPTTSKKDVKTRKSISSARLFKTLKTFVDDNNYLSNESSLDELFEILADQIVEDAIR